MGHMPRYCGKSFAVNHKRYEEPVAEKPKHCKVCYQAGFGPEVYTSHFTKVDGEILCPTILNNTCHRCGKKGHTTKYCTITVRSERNDRDRFVERRPVILSRNPRPETRPQPRPEPTPRTLTKQEMTIKYRDDRYEYDDNGRPITMKPMIDDADDQFYRRPSHFGQVQSQNILKDSITLLIRAQNSSSPEECARLVQEAMSIQDFLLRNI
jgi:hypothetical protein